MILANGDWIITFDNIYPYLIAYLPTIIFIFIIVFSTFIGYRRGFKKSGILLANSLIALSIVTIIYIVVANQQFFNYDIIKIINLFMGENGFQKALGVNEARDNMVDILIEYFVRNDNDALASILTDNGAYVLALAQALVRLVLAFVIIPLYFIFIFIGYIFYLLFRREGRRVKKHNELFSLREEAHTYSSFRIFGAAIGLFRGFLAAWILLVIIGAPLYLVFGSDEEMITVDTNNETLDQSQEIFKELSYYGNTGIYKILNQLEDSNGLPYYLFIADVVLQGNLVISEEDVDENIYFYKELSQYRQFGSDSIRLLMNYIDDGFYDSIKEGNKDGIWNYIIEVFGNKEFQAEFEALFKDLDKDTYLINLSYSLLDSIIDNIDSLGFEDNGSVIPLKILFVEGYICPNIAYEESLEEGTILPYISIRDVLSKQDLTKVLNMVFDYINLYNEYETHDTLFILDVISSLTSSVKLLDIFSKDNEGISNTFRRLYAYVFNTFLQSSNEEEYVETVIFDTTYDGTNWIDETSNLISIVPNVINLYKNKFKDVTISSDNALSLLFSLNDNDAYEDYEAIRDVVLNSNLLSVILESGIVKQIFNSVLESTFENFYYPDNANIIVLFDILDHIIQNESNESNLDYIMTSTLSKDTYEVYINSFNSVFDAYVVEKASSSPLLRSILTAVLLNTASDYIYLDDSLFDTDSDGNIMYILSENDTNDLLNNVSTLFSLAKPFILGTSDSSDIDNIINSDNIDNLLNSKVIEGTISKIIFESEMLDDSIVIPSNLKYVSVGGDSEVKYLVNAIRTLGLSLTDFSDFNFETLYENISTLTESDIKSIMNSEVIYYNASIQIKDNASEYISGLIFPNTVVESSGYKLIDKEILIDFLTRVKYIYSQGMTSDDLISNLLRYRTVLFKNCTSKDIFIATSAYMLVNDDNISSMLTSLSIPTYYQTYATKEILTSSFTSSNPWYEEVYYVMTILVEFTNAESNDYKVSFDDIETTIESSISTLNESSSLIPSLTKLELLYKSGIVSYNVTNTIKDILIDNEISTENVLDSPLVSSYSNLSHETIITSSELANFVNAINALEVDIHDSSTVSNLSITKLNDYYNGILIRYYLTKSYIARSILTTTINDLLESANIETTQGAYESYNGTIYEIYKESEINTLLSIVESDGSLSTSFIDNLTFDTFIDLIFDYNQKVKSYILLKVLTDRIIDTTSIVIPTKVYNTSYKTISGDEMYLLLNALAELGLSASTSFSLNNIALDEDYEYLYESSIIRATIPNIAEISYGSTILEFNVIASNSTYESTKDMNGLSIALMSIDEFKNFVYVLNELGITSTTATLNSSSIISFINNTNDLTTSDIVYVFLSDIISSNAIILATLRAAYTSVSTVSTTVVRLTDSINSTVDLVKIVK